VTKVLQANNNKKSTHIFTHCLISKSDRIQPQHAICCDFIISDDKISGGLIALQLSLFLSVVFIGQHQRNSSKEYVQYLEEKQSGTGQEVFLENQQELIFFLIFRAVDGDRVLC